MRGHLLVLRTNPLRSTTSVRRGSRRFSSRRERERAFLPFAFGPSHLFPSRPHLHASIPRSTHSSRVVVSARFSSSWKRTLNVRGRKTNTNVVGIRSEWHQLVWRYSIFFDVGCMPLTSIEPRQASTCSFIFWSGSNFYSVSIWFWQNGCPTCSALQRCCAVCYDKLRATIFCGHVARFRPCIQLVFIILRHYVLIAIDISYKKGPFVYAVPASTEAEPESTCLFGYYVFSLFLVNRKETIKWSGLSSWTEQVEFIRPPLTQM